MGIGIGWPNASASNQSQGIYFEITGICSGVARPGSTTQLLNNPSEYQTGDYVDFNNGEGDTGRATLGNIVETIGEDVFNISGPIYTSCPT